jgi:hypothetical protein
MASTLARPKRAKTWFAYWLQFGVLVPLTQPL